MNDKFIPFALPGKPVGDLGNTTFRLKVLPPTEGQNTAFVPSQLPSEAPVPVSAGQATVALERDAQQRITRIRLQCGCGQAHELDCIYE